MSINCEYFKFINSRVICVNKMCIMIIIIRYRVYLLRAYFLFTAIGKKRKK